MTDEEEEKSPPTGPGDGDRYPFAKRSQVDWWGDSWDMPTYPPH